MKRTTVLALLLAAATLSILPPEAQGRRRYLDPNTARFTQRDPLDYVDGNNLYEDRQNNPVNRLDPDGREVLPVPLGPLPRPEKNRKIARTVAPAGPMGLEDRLRLRIIIYVAAIPESQKLALSDNGLSSMGDVFVLPTSGNLYAGDFNEKPFAYVTYEQALSSGETAVLEHFEPHNRAVHMMRQPLSSHVKPPAGFNKAIGFRFVDIRNNRGGRGTLAYFNKQRKKLHGSGLRAGAEEMAMVLVHATGIDKLVGSSMGLATDGWGYNIMEQRFMNPKETRTHALQGLDRGVSIGAAIVGMKLSAGSGSKSIQTPQKTNLPVKYDVNAAINSALANGMVQEAMALRLSTLSSAEIAMLQSAMKATGATSWMTPKATPLLPALKAANNPAGTVPTHLEAGRLYEASRLLQMGQPKNTMVWRPTLADIDSATFKVVVGDPRYTPGGQLRGTIYDATEMSLLELKSGSSPLGSNYQLRLQTYGALKAGRPYIIETTRPINSRFAAWLKRWGVEVRAPGD